MLLINNLQYEGTEGVFKTTLLPITIQNPNNALQGSKIVAQILNGEC